MGQVGTVQEVVMLQQQASTTLQRYTSYYAVGKDVPFAPTGRIYGPFQSVHSQVAMRQRHHMSIMDSISRDFLCRMAAALVCNNVPISGVQLTEVRPAAVATQGDIAVSGTVTVSISAEIRAGNSEQAIWL